jgi:hypothetical protein
MKTFLTALAFAAVTVPGAAHAAEGAMEKCCCCEKMKQEGKTCCDEVQSGKEGEHAGHGDHSGHDMPAPQAPGH